MNEYRVRINTDTGNRTITFRADALTHNEGGDIKSYRFTNVTGLRDNQSIIGKELTLAGPNYDNSAQYDGGEGYVNFFNGNLARRVKITHMHSGIDGDNDIIMVQAYHHE